MPRRSRMYEGVLTNSPRRRIVPRPIRSQPHAISVDRFARRLVAMPTQVAPGRPGSRCVSSGTRHPRAPSIVRARDTPCRRPRRRAHPRSAPVRPRRGCARRRPASAKGRRIAFVGRMDRRGHDDAGVEIDRVLRLVGRWPFRPSSWRSWRQVGRLFQSAFDSVLPCACGRSAPGPRPSASQSCLAPSASASRGSSRHLRAARSCVERRWPPSSSYRRRSARPLHKAALGHELQHPAEHRLVRLRAADVSACAIATNGWNLLPVRQPQEIAERETNPRNAR